VREAVLHAIRRSPAPEAIAALIDLSTDEVDELREWATFALGSQLPLVDAPEIRAALASRLTDRHEATRDEAVIGLGLRADARALGPLVAMLARGAAGVPLFQAAEALGSPVLLPGLTGLIARAEDLEEPEREALAAAILACSPRGPA
jgi:HEAT repeat protein